MLLRFKIRVFRDVMPCRVINIQRSLLPSFISQRNSGFGLPDPEDGGTVWNSVRPSFFPQTVLVLKSSVPMSPKVRVGTPIFFLKYGNYVNFYKHFGFPLVVENIYINMAAISQQIRRNMKGRERSKRRLVTTECELRLQRMKNGYVK